MVGKLERLAVKVPAMQKHWFFQPTAREQTPQCMITACRCNFKSDKRGNVVCFREWFSVSSTFVCFSLYRQKLCSETCHHYPRRNRRNRLLHTSVYLLLSDTAGRKHLVERKEQLSIQRAAHEGSIHLITLNWISPHHFSLEGNLQ